MAEHHLKLVSHKLCPYVQRAVIALTEKGVSFERVDIDLEHKPDWFLAVSPLGKTPVLLVDGTPIFESAVILEYLEETQPHPLHPSDPLARAEHRAWIEFSSAVLADIWGLQTAKDEPTFRLKVQALEQKFSRVEARLGATPWFGGGSFSLVDAAFAPVFRYFDVIDRIGDFGLFANKPKLSAWRARLSQRPSVRAAVGEDYPARLRAFMAKLGAYLTQLDAPAA
ncbi:MAG: glutathione S-transferase family protein [Xanthobacteraceae bacterium]